MDSIPGPGKFHTLWSDTAHALQLWGPPSRAPEPLFLKPVRPEPTPCSKRSRHSEKRMRPSQRGAPLATAGGSPRTATAKKSKMQLQTEPETLESARPRPLWMDSDGRGHREAQKPYRHHTGLYFQNDLVDEFESEKQPAARAAGRRKSRRRALVRGGLRKPGPGETQETPERRGRRERGAGGAAGPSAHRVSRFRENLSVLLCLLLFRGRRASLTCGALNGGNREDPALQAQAPFSWKPPPRHDAAGAWTPPTVPPLLKLWPR
ncbi:hypothetical protein R6Z07F_014554 [Ovis aries]